MRESKSIALAATVIALFLLMVAGNIQTAKAESAVSVEGEWEIISTNIDALKNHVGQRQSITRKGNGFEVKWLGSGNVETYTGSETRIVRTVLEDLGSPLSGDTPPEVLRQVKGQKVPINLSYTLSADGNYMQRECDYIHMFYRSQSKRFDHYEIAPGYIKWTLRRVSGPVKVEARGDRTAAVAQVESRGEFYVLTKDGRKLAGKDANQIPLEKGTKVITGNSGHVRMKLPDDTTFTIGPNSDIVIDSFVYDTDNTP